MATTNVAFFLLFHLGVIGKDSKQSAADQLQQLKDDLMDAGAYEIMVLDLSGSSLDKMSITSLYRFIEAGLFPRLRIIDLYCTCVSLLLSVDCNLSEDVATHLSNWISCFPFIDVLAPELIRIFLLSCQSKGLRCLPTVLTSSASIVCYS